MHIWVKPFQILSQISGTFITLVPSTWGRLSPNSITLCMTLVSLGSLSRPVIAARAQALHTTFRDHLQPTGPWMSLTQVLLLRT